MIKSISLSVVLPAKLLANECVPVGCVHHHRVVVVAASWLSSLHTSMVLRVDLLSNLVVNDEIVSG
jgi:hypothetical protein